jgi:O-antigen ligase
MQRVLQKNDVKIAFCVMAILVASHFDNVIIGGVRFSLLWKAIALGLIIYFVKQPFVPRAYVLLFILLVMHFASMTADAFGTYASSSLWMITLIVVTMFFRQIDGAVAEKFLKTLAVGTILSFIPFHLGILQSGGYGYDLSIYGGTRGLFGVFQNPHAASISLALSIIAVLILCRLRSLPVLAVLALGLYFLVLSGVRTGVVMLGVGVLSLSLARGFVRLAITILATFVIGLSVATFIGDEARAVIENRLFDRTLYSTSDTGFTGSGRTAIYGAALAIFLSDFNFMAMLLGAGVGAIPEMMWKYTGMAVGTHNAFLDALLRYGFIGFILFCSFHFILFSSVLKRVKGRMRDLALTFYPAFALMAFVQGIDWLYPSIILAVLASRTLAPARSPRRVQSFSQHRRDFRSAALDPQEQVTLQRPGS